MIKLSTIAKWAALAAVVGTTASFAATMSAEGTSSADRAASIGEVALTSHTSSASDTSQVSTALLPAQAGTSLAQAVTAAAASSQPAAAQVAMAECGGGGSGECGDCSDSPSGPGGCDECVGVPDVNQAIPLPPSDLVADVAADGGPWRGDEGAPVEIVMFTTFECKFCLRSLGTLDELLDMYRGKVRVVHRFFPLSEQAIATAEAALAAHVQGKFWGMHDKLFANQGAHERADLLRYAAELGLDMDRFRADLDSHSHCAAVIADRDAGMSLGVRGTPSFFINGERIIGHMPIARYSEIINRKLAEAKTAAAVQ